MLQENVEIVRRTWEIVQRVTDVGAAFDECVREGLVAPDFWCTVPKTSADPQTATPNRRGRGGVIQGLVRGSHAFARSA